MDKAKKSLLKRIGILTMTLLVLMFLIYVLISNQLINNFFEAETQKKLLKDAKHIAIEIDGFFAKNKEITEQMKTNEDFSIIMREINNQGEKRSHPLYQRVQTALLRIKESNEDISLVYLAINDANDLITTVESYNPEADYKLASRDWYQQTIEQEEPYVSQPYQDLVTGDWVVSITAPVFENEKLLGVMGIDLKIEEIFALMEDFQVGENGETFLLNENGENFYKPDGRTRAPKLITKKLIDTFDQANFQKKDGEYVYLGEEKYYAFVSADNIDWIVGTVISKSEALASIRQFSIINIAIFLAFLSIIGFFLYYFLNQISKPMIRISNEVQDMGENKWQLNFPEAYFKREDEIGILVRGLHLMNQSVNKFFDEIEMKNKCLNEEIENRKDIQYHLELILELISFSKEGIFILDHKFICIFINQAFESLIGFSENELDNFNLLEKELLINDEIVKQLRKNKLWVGEIQYLNNSMEKEKILFLKLIEVKNNNKIYYIGNLNDISEEKQIQKNIYQLKYFDALTGLYNKTYFDEIVATLIKKNLQKNQFMRLLLSISIISG